MAKIIINANAPEAEVHKIKTHHQHRCPICGDHPTVTRLVDYEQAACDLKQH